MPAFTDSLTLQLFAAAGLALVAGLVLLILQKIEVRFQKKVLLNKSEMRLFHMIEAMLRGKPYRLLCQVSYGEFLRTRSKKAFWKVNAKRADFLIVDQDFNPVAVIEYQGAGHFGRTGQSADLARQRDNTKKRACLSAGLAWIEVPAKIDRAALDSSLRAVLNKSHDQDQPLRAPKCAAN